MSYLMNEETVNSQAQKMLDLADQLSARIGGVETAIQGLVESVHGNASVNCNEQWETAKEAMMTYIPKIEDVANRLTNAATTTTDVDQGLSDGLQVQAEARA